MPSPLIGSTRQTPEPFEPLPAATDDMDATPSIRINTSSETIRRSRGIQRAQRSPPPLQTNFSSQGHSATPPATSKPAAVPSRTMRNAMKMLYSVLGGVQLLFDITLRDIDDCAASVPLDERLLGRRRRKGKTSEAVDEGIFAETDNMHLTPRGKMQVCRAASILILARPRRMTHVAPFDASFFFTTRSRRVDVFVTRKTYAP